jgi:hypothetical protein
MSTSTGALGRAAQNRKRSSRKSISKNLFGGASIACLVVGCGWTVYANIFAASPYPQLGSANFDTPVIRRPRAVAVSSTPRIIDTTRIAEIDRPPRISAPATIPSGPQLSFDERFAASAAQGVEPKPDTPKLAETSPPVAAPKLAEAAKPKEVSPPPVQVAAIAPAQAPPAAPRPSVIQSAKNAGASVRDMAQRAKAAVMSIASAEKPTIVEKLWGKPQARGSLLSYASADASSITGSLGPSQNPALAGSAPYDRSTAVYDISAHMVYLPDGSKLEAHSGLGSKLDDPSSANIRMHGVTPPHLYDLTPREALFHGVPALRLNPVGGEQTIYGRSGLLAHTFMLGPNGDSNGCVSFRDYNAFLNAYRNQGIKRLAVVARVE